MTNIDQTLSILGTHAAAVREADVARSAGFTAGFAKSSRSRALTTAMSASFVGLLLLNACSEDSSNEDSSPVDAIELEGAGSNTTGSEVTGSEMTESTEDGLGAAGASIDTSVSDGSVSTGSAEAGSGSTGTAAAGSAETGSGSTGTAAAGLAEAGSGETDTTTVAELDAGESDSAQDAGMPDENIPGERAPAVSFSFPMTKESIAEEPYFIIYRPEDMDAAIVETGQLLPVIVWGNGGCLRFSAAWETLFQKWSAGGFVVLAIDVRPDNNPMVMHSAEEHDALVDWVIAENSEAGSPYEGKLDITRIVSTGNSCGGVTALNVAAMDDRVAAVFVLSGSSALGSTDVNVMSAISAPVGYIEGGPEDVSRAPAEADYAALSDGVPAMIATRSTGDHITISYSDQTIVAREAEISLNWMDLALYGTQEAYDTLTSPTVCTGCEPGLWTLTSKHIETLLQ